MHFISTLAAFLHLLPAITITSAFEWRSPDPNNKLDLSAPSIAITWDPNAGSGTEYQQVDLWFHATGATGTIFSWNLESNITVADGNYAWEPEGVIESLDSTNNTLSADKVHYFEARLHNANDTSGAGIESGKYEIEGYDNIGSGGVGMRQSLLGATTGAFVVMMVWCL